MQTLLGIDLGTSGVKAALIATDDGHVIADAFVTYPLYHPHPGWAEQQPDEWWQATIEAIRTCLARSSTQGIRPDEIRGVGLSGQMQGLVPLDGTRNVLRPCIIWSDQRSDEQCRWMIERVGVNKLLEHVSNCTMTADVAPKLLWVRDKEAEIFARIQTILLPKDYIRYCLTGTMAIEISDAAGTNLLDVEHGTWSREVINALELDASLLPPVVASDAVAGQITKEVANLTGLREGTPVAGGGADNACGAVGNGIVEPGLMLVSIGTSGVVLAHMNKPLIDRSGPVPRVQTLNHAVPNAWYFMGVTQGAGFSFHWLRDNIGLPEHALEKWAGIDAYDLLTKEAESVAPGSDGLLFLPYMQGERTPHLDAYARGGWIGLTASHDRRHLIRSVMEGVAFSLKDCFNIIRDQGLQLSQLRTTGGGAKSPLWRQIIADVLGVELTTTNASEGPAFGAALLAGVAGGVYPSIQEACKQMVRTIEYTTPQSQNAAIYERAYNTYQALYPALKPILSHSLV